MILADTSVWVEHLRGRTRVLADLLQRDLVLGHPFVVGEIMLGGAKPDIIARMKRLAQATVATAWETLDFIERHKFAGHGVGYVDVHLLISSQLTPETRLWTLDKRLQSVAESLSISARL